MSDNVVTQVNKMSLQGQQGLKFLDCNCQPHEYATASDKQNNHKNNNHKESFHLYSNNETGDNTYTAIYNNASYSNTKNNQSPIGHHSFDSPPHNATETTHSQPHSHKDQNFKKHSANLSDGNNMPFMVNYGRPRAQY
jgi:hypothetical protein